MSDFLEFYNTLDSVGKDNLYFTLIDLIEDNTYLKQLEEELEDVKLQVDRINKDREELSNQLSKLNKTKQLFQLDNFDESMELSFIDLMIGHKIDQLRYKIEESKPTELLKKKFLLHNEIKYIRITRTFISKILGVMKNGRN